MKNEWLIIFVIYADFFGAGRQIQTEEKLTREIKSLYADLTSTTIDSSCAIYCIVNSIRHAGKGEKEDRTIIQRVIRGKQGECNSIEEVATINLKNALQRQEILRAALGFVNCLEDTSKNVAVFTWDHGAVFGINREEGRRSVIRRIQSIDYDKLITCRKDKAEAGTEASVFFKYQNNVLEIEKDSLKRFEEIIKNMNLYNVNLKTETIEFSLIDTIAITVKSNKPDFKWGTNKNKDLQGFNNYTYEISKENRAEFLSYLKKNKTENLREEIMIRHENGFRTIIKGNTGSIFQIMNAISDPPPAFRININYQLEMLKNTELAQAISSGLKKGKADLLLMMNCNMMNVHAISAFKKNVDFFVAPESGIDEPGYNYCAILNEIKAGMTPRSLADICVSTLRNSPGCGSNDCKIYRDKYMTENNDPVSLFGADLNSAFVDSVLGIINEFGKRMTTKMKDKTHRVYREMKAATEQTVKNNCTLQTNFGKDFFLYDIIEWLDSMEVNLVREEDFKNLNLLIKEDIVWARSKLISQKNRFIHNENQTGEKKFSSFGIFFPFEKVTKKTGTDAFIEAIKKGEEPDSVSDWLAFLVHFFP